MGQRCFLIASYIKPLNKGHLWDVESILHSGVLFSEVVIIAERISVRQLLRVIFSQYTYVRTYVSVTLKNVN